MIVFFIFLFCLLVVLSSVSSIAETCFFSLSSGQIQELSRSDKAGGQTLARILARPRELLVTLLFMNVLMNILVQNVASSAFTEDSNLLVQVGIPFITTFFFCDLIPKILALQNNVKFSQKLAPMFAFFMRILSPVIPYLSKVASSLGKVIFFFLRSREPIDSRQLLRALERLSGHEEILDPHEKKLMQGLVELQHYQAQDVMWPRSEILIYDIQEPLEKLLSLIFAEECGKIPVCDGGLDKVLGVLYVKDIAGKKMIDITQKDVFEALRKPLFVPETTSAVMLLRQLDDAYQSLALVVDEYGSVSGLLTREDLLEVIIGEIIDRRDHKKWYTLVQEGVIIASASWEIEGVEKLLGVSLPNPHKAQSLGGWLTSVHGSIPEEGWQSVFEDYIFEVIEASASHIRQVKITRMGSVNE